MPQCRKTKQPTTLRENAEQPKRLHHDMGLRLWRSVNWTWPVNTATDILPTRTSEG
jgi:hypothetical protein